MGNKGREIKEQKKRGKKRKLVEKEGNKWEYGGKKRGDADVKVNEKR